MEEIKIKVVSNKVDKITEAVKKAAAELYYSTSDGKSYRNEGSIFGNFMKKICVDMLPKLTHLNLQMKFDCTPRHFGGSSLTIILPSGKDLEIFDLFFDHYSEEDGYKYLKSDIQKHYSRASESVENLIFILGKKM